MNESDLRAEQDIGEVSAESIRELLRRVLDPDLHINIVDLGLVYNVELQGAVVSVAMTLTSPACPYGPYLVHQVQELVKTVKGVDDVQLDIVWDPPWGPERMSEEVRLDLGFDV